MKSFAPMSLSLLKIEPHLSKCGGSLWVYSGRQIGFLQEISPPRPSIFLALTHIEIVESSLCGLNSLDDAHHSARLVSSLIKPNHCE
jgi:hypothetical protein